MKTHEPVDSVSLKKILGRSAKGESVALVIRDLGLPLMDTLESLKRRHNDDVKKAKKEYRERL